MAMADFFSTTYRVLLILAPLTLPDGDFGVDKVVALRFATMANMEELEFRFRCSQPRRMGDLEHYYKSSGLYLRVLLDAVRVAVLALTSAGACITPFARRFNAYIKTVVERGALFVPDPETGAPFVASISRGLRRLGTDPFARSALLVGAGRSLTPGAGDDGDAGGDGE